MRLRIIETCECSECGWVYDKKIKWKYISIGGPF